MDAYGPRVPIGGGAWSGKDFFKAHRAEGLHARRLAKLVVELGLATEARVTLQWFPGDREARVIDIQTPPEEHASTDRITRFLDSSLARSGEYFLVEDIVEIARWGHFEKTDYPWEKYKQI